MRPLRVYLAGASAEVALCEGYRDRLRGAGVWVVRDWMSEVRAHAAAGQPDHEIPVDQRARYAMNDLEGVAACDGFWLLIPQGGGIGAWVELGYALALAHRFPRPKLVVSGRWRSIFTDMLDRFDEHEQAFEWIVARAAQGGRP